jgi:hypothetical protein
VNNYLKSHDFHNYNLLDKPVIYHPFPPQAPVALRVAKSLLSQKNLVASGNFSNLAGFEFPHYTLGIPSIASSLPSLAPLFPPVASSIC